MFNRWNVEVKHGLNCDYFYGRDGTDKLTGRIQSVDSHSSFARAYGAQVKLTDGMTIGADSISRTWCDAPKPKPIPRNGAPLGILFSTHKQSTHRLTEEFYSAGKGAELGGLPNGIYWRGSDKPYFVK